MKQIKKIIKEEVEKHFEKKSFVILSTTARITIRKKWLLFGKYIVTIYTNRLDLWTKNRDMIYKIENSPLIKNEVKIKLKENVVW